MLKLPFFLALPPSSRQHTLPKTVPAQVDRNIFKALVSNKLDTGRMTEEEAERERNFQAQCSRDMDEALQLDPQRYNDARARRTQPRRSTALPSNRTLRRRHQLQGGNERRLRPAAHAGQAEDDGYSKTRTMQKASKPHAGNTGKRKGRRKRRATRRRLKRPLHCRRERVSSVMTDGYAAHMHIVRLVDTEEPEAEKKPKCTQAMRQQYKEAGGDMWELSNDPGRASFYNFTIGKTSGELKDVRHSCYKRSEWRQQNLTGKAR